MSGIMECFGRSAKKDLYCSVRLLDESELKLSVQRHTRGGDVLDRVFEKLNLLEKDYFGLRFLDSQDQTHWLDPVKPISKQIRNGPPFLLYFGVKFYMENPCRLKEEVTRYQFFLQLRMDMLQGRLPCGHHAAAELCAYAVQSELGDYDPSQHSEGYISEFRFLPGQTEELEKQITQLHQKLKGMTPSKAEASFLERARWLEMYGVDLHPVQGENGVEFFLGLTPTGVVVYKNKTQVARYYWPRIAKVHFKDTEFMLRVLNKEGLGDECVFKLPSRSASKHLWKCCVEQHAFFRLPQVGADPIHPRKLSFSNSSFRHTGRTQREALEAASTLDRPEQLVQRSASRKYSRRPSQTDVSLRNLSATDELLLDESLMSRLSPQPATRLPSGRESPTSAMSVHSVPWEDSQQARAGLFSSAGGVPASRQHRHRGRSKSPGPGHRYGEQRSDSESEAAYSARRRRRRSLGSEAGSDTESRQHNHHHHHHHHQHRKRRSRSRGVSSGSESEYSRHDDDRRRRRRSRDRNGSGEEQWAGLDGDRMVRGEMREGQEVVVRSLRDGYPDSESSSRRHHHRNQHNHHHHHHHHHPQRERANAELQKHIQKELVDPEKFTEEERRVIPYTNLRIDGDAAISGNGSQRLAPSQHRSKQGDSHSDGDTFESSTRHGPKVASPPSPAESPATAGLPVGTPPPPYALNGAGPSRGHVHPAREPRLESRGEAGLAGGAPPPLIHNGEVKGGLFARGGGGGGGLFGGRPQQELPQVQMHPSGSRAADGSLPRDRHPDRPPDRSLDRPPQGKAPPAAAGVPAHTLALDGLTSVEGNRREASAGPRHHRHHLPPQTQPLAAGTEAQPRGPSPVPNNGLPVNGLPVVHSRGDSGLGNEEGQGDSRSNHLSLPRQIVQTSSVQSQRAPSPSINHAGHTAASLTAFHNPTGPHRVNGTHSRGHEGGRQADAARALPNGGPQLSPELQVAHGRSALPGRVGNRRADADTAPGNGGPVVANANADRAAPKAHLWSKPAPPQRGAGHQRANGTAGSGGTARAGNRGSNPNAGSQLVDLPPGYKPDYSRDKRYSITTQEMMRVSMLQGDHRHLQTEL